MGHAAQPFLLPAAFRPPVEVDVRVSPVPRASMAAAAGTHVPLGKGASSSMISKAAHIKSGIVRSVGQREDFEAGEGAT